MAQAIIHQGRPLPDPTVSLKEALVSFENALTEEQKRLYIATATPNASSVIAFVTEVDSSNQSRARRCVAPRLCTFLDAAHQFIGVVDTFVNYNPVPAALVWGSLKTAIVTAGNTASYFDKVTSMIMEIGRHSPVYEQFAHLYPGSVGLQHALCEYWAAIIRLCTKIVEGTQRGFAQNLLTAFTGFEVEFQPFRIKLKELTEDVRLQISLASKQALYEQARLAEHDRREAQRNRALTLMFRSDVGEEHKKADEWRLREIARKVSKLRSSIRKNLSTVDHLKAWKQALRPRTPCTAEWIHREPKFQDWMNDDKTSILWCSGTLGVGKTVLASNIIAYLHHLPKPEILVCYHFCKTEDSASLSARNILGSFSRQILNSRIEAATEKELERLKTESEDLDNEGIVDLMLRYLESGNTYYVILDGIDEIERDDVRVVAQSMSRVCREQLVGIKYLCTGRPEIEKELFRGMSVEYKIPIRKHRVDQDIEKYLDVKLDQYIEDGRLVLGDPNLRSVISKVLKTESNGMFLWVHLFIDEICAKDDDNAIIHALQHSPKGLSELLDQKFARVSKHASSEQAIKVLKYCGVLKRPLTIDEFKELLGISVGQQYFDRTKLPNTIHRIVAACCGLVHIDEEYDTLHYVHHSIESYLFRDQVHSRPGFKKQDLDTNVGILCMTYLDFNDFKRQLVKHNKYSDMAIDPIQIGTTAVTGSSKPTRIMQKLLQHRQRTQRLTGSEIERKTLEAVEGSATPRQQFVPQRSDFFLLEYAKIYWIYHLLKKSEIHDLQTRNLIRRCLTDNDLPQKPWNMNPDVGDESQHWDQTFKMYAWFVANDGDAVALATVMTFPKSGSPITQDEILQSVIRHDSKLAVKMIKCSELKRDTLNNALLYVPSNWFTFDLPRDGAELVQALLEAGADDGATGIDGYTALSAATERSYHGLVMTLIKFGANVNARNGDGSTALLLSARHGHLLIVEDLLEAGADVTATQCHGDTSLSCAALKGHLEIVKVLLKAGADVNAINEHGCTALFSAVWGGVLEILIALLEAGADVDVTHTNGDTPLSYAIRIGRPRMVAAILEAGVGRGTLKSDDLAKAKKGAEVRGQADIADVVRDYQRRLG